MTAITHPRPGSLLLAALTGATLLGACADDGAATGSGGASAASAGAGGAGGDGPAGAGGGGSSPQTSSTSLATTGAGGAADDAPTTPVTYRPSTEVVANPERGFYSSVDLLGESDLDWVLERGHTLVHSYVRLDDHRDEPLPGSLLQAIDEGMALLRESGVKVVLRFSYNFGPYPDSEPDAPLDRVLEHIDQLAPVLDAHQDVIAVLQAGFIGAWGEWHTSTNDLDAPGARAAILDALLEALPPSRSVVLRYPPHKQAIFGEPLDAASAWSGADAARTGHHNDCFLSSETDVGTYPSGEVELWKEYLEADTTFVPMGGETCAVFPPRSECASALDEMERLHFTFLNQDYHPDVVDGWIADGCKLEMDRRLGYRLELVSADLPPTVRPGGTFVLRLRIRNVGFAAPINPRQLRLVVAVGGERHEVTLPGADARHLLPGADVEVAARVHLPASLPEGPATLSLWLPDPDLADDPRFAIQLANQGTWSAADGLNLLGIATIDDAGPGGADPGAAELTAAPVP